MKHVFICSLLIFSALTQGCKKDKDEIIDSPLQAKLMVIHASPDGNEINVRLNNANYFPSVLYGSSGGYVPVNTGQTLLRASQAGNPAYVIDTVLSLGANSNYSLFIIDSAKKMKGALVYDVFGGPSTGKSLIRFLHFSPNTPTIDLGITGGTNMFSNRSFNDQSVDGLLAAFKEIDAGVYSFDLKQAGTQTVLVSVPGINIAAGNTYTIIAKGFLGGAGIQAPGIQLIKNN